MTKREKQQRDDIKRTLADMYAAFNFGNLPGTNPDEPEYYLSGNVGIEEWCSWIRSAAKRLCPVPSGVKVDIDDLIHIWTIPQWDTIKGATEEVLRIRGVVADRAARQKEEQP